MKYKAVFFGTVINAENKRQSFSSSCFQSSWRRLSIQYVKNKNYVTDNNAIKSRKIGEHLSKSGENNLDFSMSMVTKQKGTEMAPWKRRGFTSSGD